MESKTIKIPARVNSALYLKVIPGHFATSHSHINYYVDMTDVKCQKDVAELAARVLADSYKTTTPVDTIVCMDGTDVIGAYLAESLTQHGIMSFNQGESINIVTPEVHSNGQLIFRDNLQPMVRDKNIVLLVASATTGKTIEQSLECIRYYGGKISGVSALFSASDNIAGVHVDSIFHVDDIEGYKSYDPSICPHCKAGEKLDAIINGYGYSKL